jgi:hypothetical protein
MIRFLHTSDLHLGKPFGGFPEEVRARLRQARLDAIPRLAAAARDGGASHVLLAGDSFDQQTPTPQTLRQALNAMRGAGDLTWVLMPGNHDSLAATQIWPVIAADPPPNLVPALDAAPVDLAPGVVLLPAPLPVRHPGRDLTDWMDAADTGAAIRIGLAHGGVHDFRAAEEISDGPKGIIAPDRAARAGLDYLALGDWHGQIRIGPQTWYSGTPEADSFGAAPASALLVSIAGHGALPEVTPVETGALHWTRIALDLLPGEDGAAQHDRALPALGQRAKCLLDLVATGRASLSGRAALQSAVAAAQPDFLWHRADLSALAISQTPEDLDLIAPHGALRSAAEVLAAEAAAAPDAEKRDAARGALARLFSYQAEAQ